MQIKHENLLVFIYFRARRNIVKRGTNRKPKQTPKQTINQHPGLSSLLKCDYESDSEMCKLRLETYLHREMYMKLIICAELLAQPGRKIAALTTLSTTWVWARVTQLSYSSATCWPLLLAGWPVLPLGTENILQVSQYSAPWYDMMYVNRWSDAPVKMQSSSY